MPPKEPITTVQEWVSHNHTFSMSIYRTADGIHIGGSLSSWCHWGAAVTCCESDIGGSFDDDRLRRQHSSTRQTFLSSAVRQLVVNRPRSSCGFPRGFQSLDRSLGELGVRSGLTRIDRPSLLRACLLPLSPVTLHPHRYRLLLCRRHLRALAFGSERVGQISGSLTNTSPYPC
jgi:hypothetical protein